MSQGIVLINSTEISDLEKDDFQFFNTQIRDTFISDLERFPKYQKKFEKYKRDRGITENDQIDFIRDPDAFKFLAIKIYTRKVDNQDYSGGQADDSVSCNSSQDQQKNYSLLDIIAKIESHPEEVREETFQMNNKKILKTQNSQEEISNKFFVINWFDMKFYN